MGREPKGFDWMTKWRVWRKATPLQGYDPAEWRLDPQGSLLRFTRYGDTSSLFGWEIERIRSAEEGGGDYLENLQPLQWQKNRPKSGRAL